MGVVTLGSQQKKSTHNIDHEEIDHEESIKSY